MISKAVGALAPVAANALGNLAQQGVQSAINAGANAIQNKIAPQPQGGSGVKNPRKVKGSGLFGSLLGSIIPQLLAGNGMPKQHGGSFLAPGFTQ